MHLDDVTELKSAFRWPADVDGFLARMTARIDAANKKHRGGDTIEIETGEAEDFFPALVAAWEFAKEHAHEIQ